MLKCFKIDILSPNLLLVIDFTVAACNILVTHYNTITIVINTIIWYLNKVLQCIYLNNNTEWPHFKNLNENILTSFFLRRYGDIGYMYSYVHILYDYSTVFINMLTSDYNYLQIIFFSKDSPGSLRGRAGGRGPS